MKKIILILVIVAAVVWAMTNREQADGYARDAKQWFDVTVLKKSPSPVQVEAEQNTVVESTPGPAPSTKPSVNVSPVAETPPPVSETRETLPEGVYYTKERVSQVTDQGVAAIAKGVKVKKVGEKNGDYLITDGVLELSAARFQLTRDDAEIAVLTAVVAPAQVVAVKKVSATTSASIKPRSDSPHPEIPALKSKLQVLDDKIFSLKREVRNLENEREYAKLRGRVSSSHVQIGRIQGQIDQTIGERQRVAARLAEVQ